MGRGHPSEEETRTELLKVAGRLKAMGKERQEIADALGVKVKTLDYWVGEARRGAYGEEIAMMFPYERLHDEQRAMQGRKVGKQDLALTAKRARMEHWLCVGWRRTPEQTRTYLQIRQEYWRGRDSRMRQKDKTA